ERLADAEQTLLRPHLRVRVVPLRATDGTEQHGIGRPRGLDILLTQGSAVLVDGATAEQAIVEIEGIAALIRDGLQHATRLTHHVRPDAVSGEHDDGILLRHDPPFGLNSMRARKTRPRGPGRHDYCAANGSGASTCGRYGFRDCS